MVRTNGVRTYSCSMDEVNVRQKIENVEKHLIPTPGTPLEPSTSPSTEKPTAAPSSSQDSIVHFPIKPRQRKRKEPCNPFISVIRSRYIGFFIGPLYGVFVYYYITYLILNGSQLTVGNVVSPGQSPNDQYIRVQKREVAPKTVDEIIAEHENEKKDGVPGKTANVESEPIKKFLDNRMSHIIGGSVGAGTGVALAIGSVFSAQIRCGMMLIIPSICARRGRAFMITAATGFLLSGPIATIDYNIQQVVTSLTCMYEQVKSMADLYVEQFKQVWTDTFGVFQQVNGLMQSYHEQMKELAMNATATSRKKFLETKHKLESQLRDLKYRMKKVQRTLNSPVVRAAGYMCEKTQSALAWVSGAGRTAHSWFEKAAMDIHGFLNGISRTKRETEGEGDACGLSYMIPDINVYSPDINFDALTNFLDKLNPGIKLMDVDFDQVTEELEYHSIANIRQRLKMILRTVFVMVHNYSGYIKTIFYLSIILVIRDAFIYMRNYYSDDVFDNMMVDDNLRQVWRSGEKEKILPLRKWELTLKYQYSAAVKLSKAEAKRIFFQAVPTILFTVVAISICIVDYAFSSLLHMFRREGEFGISYKGMEQGVSFQAFLPGLKTGDIDVSALKLKGFNLSTEPCLPRAMDTDQTTTVVIISIVTVSFLSCIFNAYAYRLRAKICNLYFPQRAKERAQYLYKRIAVGRAMRRIQLPMMVGRELDKRDRSAEFSYISTKLYKLMTCCRQVDDNCPSCLHVMKKDEERSYCITRKGVKYIANICEDCHKDI